MRLKDLSEEQTRELFPDGLILGTYRGSIAHGMYVPQEDPNSIDDKDVMAVYVCPLRHYLGFPKHREDVKEKWLEPWDAVSYEVRKFVGLLLKSNPNVLSMLWVRDGMVFHSTEWGQMLRDNRSAFVTKKAYHSFSGYAHSQLHRMTHGANKGYMGDKRKRLVEEFGYDTKNAAHLIRLLKMGIEFLTEGELHVERQDAATLLDIKRGKWTLEKVQGEADRLFALAEEAHVRSPLPPEPDFTRAERLVMNIVRGYHGI